MADMNIVAADKTRNQVHVVKTLPQ